MDGPVSGGISVQRYSGLVFGRARTGRDRYRMTMAPLRVAAFGRSWSWNLQVRTELRFPVSRLWPTASKPIWLISVQSVWSGCGSLAMLWDRESLFTNRTLVPGDT